MRGCRLAQLTSFSASPRSGEPRPGRRREDVSRHDRGLRGHRAGGVAQTAGASAGKAVAAPLQARRKRSRPRPAPRRRPRRARVSLGDGRASRGRPRGSARGRGRHRPLRRYRERFPRRPRARRGSRPRADAGDERGRAVALRLAHGAAVARPIDRLLAAAELRQRGHVRAHRAVGRRHDRRRPGHHGVAGEERALFAKRETEMIGAMAGRGDDLDRKSACLEPLAVGENRVGRIGAVVRGVEAAGPLALRLEGRAPTMRAPVASRSFPASTLWSRWVWVTRMVSTRSPSTAARIAERWELSPGPGSTTATSPSPTI